MAKKKISGIFTKYDYTGPNPRIISEETDTVPDLVLSMAEIYRKYSVTGDISALPGRVRPVMQDNGDEFDDSFDSEEIVDSYLHAKDIRDDVRTRQQAPANPAEEDKPVGDEGAVKKEPSAPPKQEEPAANPDSQPDVNAGSK